ncbi:hypothetical protein SSS_08853 [Sarcoptes scabiei]|nr:hypothetical protein SSS_08853 [Sarcoptes scabiei]
MMVAIRWKKKQMRLFSIMVLSVHSAKTKIEKQSRGAKYGHSKHSPRELIELIRISKLSRKRPELDESSETIGSEMKCNENFMQLQLTIIDISTSSARIVCEYWLWCYH